MLTIENTEYDMFESWFSNVRFDICPVIRKMLIFGEECEKAAVRFSKSIECGVEKEEPPPQLTQFQARFSFQSISQFLYNNDTV